MIPLRLSCGWIRSRRKRRWVAAAALVVAAAAAVLVVGQLPFGQGWTGVVIAVQACPVDDQGCRAFVIPASDERLASPPVVAYADWSGAATTLDVRVAPGSYGVIIEGCRADSLGYMPVNVTSGSHPGVHMNPGFWAYTSFLFRSCPGFHPFPGQSAGPGSPLPGS
jgi:hypothetical protein